MELLVFLILVPFLTAFLLLAARGDPTRRALTIAGSLITILSAFAILVTWYAGCFPSSPAVYPIDSKALDILVFLLEILIGGYIISIAVRGRQKILLGITCLQVILIIIVEWMTEQVTAGTGDLFIDQFSVIMALIIGVIGGLICIYAIGYMREYHAHHPGCTDRRTGFFFLLFIFLGAMYGIVFSNNLMLLFFFWEITTLCSYLLIGYPKTEEATANAFRALLYNQIGSIGFILAIIWLLATDPSGASLGMNTLIAAGSAAIIPAVLIGFAGLSKAAQLPFSSWLVGAMVAPTPVSALLHSSTMVKAGVYVIVRFAPVYEGELAGILIALAGGLTFLVASAIAVSESNAKKVLAYSTIANLGLIVTCAGVGSPGAIWAALFLIIFHAISKSLLFLSVGTVEHRIGSRDIEDMTALIVRMPKVGMVILFGIAGMFLAPFGMLISKWASLHAFAEAVPPFGMILITILAYGSGITVFFWAKWMGKIIAIRSSDSRDPVPVSRDEWTALFPLAILTVIVCFFFPVISWTLVEPYLGALFGTIDPLLSISTIEIMFLMLIIILILPLAIARIGRPERHSQVYLGGLAELDGPGFQGSLAKQEIVLSNYYLEEWFGEKRLVSYGSAGAIIIFVCIAVVAWGIL